MKKILLSCIIIALLFPIFSCKKADDNSSEGLIDTSEARTIPETGISGREDRAATDVSTDASEETSIDAGVENRIQFPQGAIETTVTGSIKGFGDNITYIFEAKEGQVLSASVSPVKGEGNIRISQIISPSGNADGPFGTSIDYKLIETGNWKIILGEDQMAGDPWEGSFNLSVKIE